jgi:hypothetical protein
MKTGNNVSATPSIGCIGMTVDRINDRIKILCPDQFDSVANIEQYLKNTLVSNPVAVDLLDGLSARFTSRVFCKDVECIAPFELHKGLVVAEEARIKTALGIDIVYVGGNRPNRFILGQLAEEYKLSSDSSQCKAIVPEPDVSFEQLDYPLSQKDVWQLLDMYHQCFTDYLVSFDETLVQNAARGAIFIVARNDKKQIIASAIGESLRVGKVTLLEVSEVATHPLYRIKGAASGCVRRVIQKGRATLAFPVVPFWEARMWRNILGIGPLVGLDHLGGVLHQHCKIASPENFTTIQQSAHGSLAVFYGN